MPAFNFRLLDYSKCVSKKNVTCSYDEGMFKFDNNEIQVGNSGENNNGGIAGFVGQDHEYFLYCGSKHPEIAVVKLNEDTDEWKAYACMQWFNFNTYNKEIFKKIWFTKEEPALMFQPTKEFRKYIIEYEGLAEGTWGIKLNLSSGRFTGISRKQFIKQKHSALDENSIWPLLSLGNDLSEVGNPSSLSGSTLRDDEIPLHPPQLEDERNQVDMMLELRTKLDTIDLQLKIQGEAINEIKGALILSSHVPENLAARISL